MAEIVKIEGLKKSFGEIKAVDGISFSVKEGSFFCVFGNQRRGKIHHDKHTLFHFEKGRGACGGCRTRH